MPAPPAHLLPEFDPNSLKIAELRGILLQHSIPYNTATKKQDLVNLYEQQLRPQAPKLLKELLAVQPSSHGILDGHSQSGSSIHDSEFGTDSDEDDQDHGDDERTPGASLAKNKKKNIKSRASAAATGGEKGKGKGRGRKSSVNLAQADDDQDDKDEDVFLSDTAKGKGKKPIPTTTTTTEAASPRKRRLGSTGPEEHAKRARASISAEPHVSSAEKDRRTSLKYESGNEESGFSDYNPFQSGGEGTPGASARKARRKSSMGPVRREETPLAGPLSAKKARKSMPATVGSWSNDLNIEHDEQYDNDASPAPAVAVAPPVPPIPQQHRQEQAQPKAESPVGTPTPMVGVRYMAPATNLKQSPPEAVKLQREYDSYQREKAVSSDDGSSSKAALRWTGSTPPDKEASGRNEIRKTPAPNKRQALGLGRVPHTSTIPRKSSNLVPRPPSQIVIPTPGPSTKTSFPSLTPLALIPLFVTLLAPLAIWREEKVMVGFCDTGSNTNTNSRQLGREWSLVFPELHKYVPAILKPHLLPEGSTFNPFPTCTPCPTHGTCRDGTFLSCASEYVPRAPSPILSIGGLLPLPPKCVPDTEKLLAIAEIASVVSRRLRGVRGEVVCDWKKERERKREWLRMIKDHNDDDDAGDGDGEPWVYGLKRSDVEEEVKLANEELDSPRSDAFLEDVIRLGIADLVSLGEAVSQDVKGDIWLAATTADMPLSCRARRAALSHAKEHKSELGYVFLLIAFAFWVRSKFQSRRKHGEVVRELVQTALQQLREQERMHYADPVLTPYSHLAPSHLRDLVLQHVHSSSERQRLWKQVEKIVEGNSNVRAKQVEHHGEEIRAWEWVGLAGPSSRPGTPGGTREKDEPMQEISGGGLYPKLK
ncbi:hypothetical protein T439DRAFT_321156 [Meredithblackwellia eburnea MCA 4105]